METMTVSKVTVAIICMVALLSLSQVEGQLTCGRVASSVSGCISYLQRGGAIPPACCNGAKSLLSLAKTPLDRKQACSCLKNLAGSVKGINLALAGGIPGKCGVRSPFPISLNTDCSKVH